LSVIYSTQALEGDRREAWEAVISTLYASLDMNIGRDTEFSGEITQSKFDDIELTLAKAQYELAQRTRRHIAADACGQCVFVLVRKGPLTISQFGREVTLPDESLSILDLDSPFSLKHASATESFFLKVRGVAAEPRLGQLRDRCAVARPVGRGIGRIAADLIVSLNANAADLAPDEAARVAGEMLDLLGIVFDADAADMPGGPSIARAAIRRRALTYIDLHLGDPSLDPAQVAAAVGVSTRYLHRVFEDGDQSLATSIRMRRLERCRADLTNQRRHGERISAIASRNGFTSQSLFAASFRKAFGISPRELRRAGGETQVGDIDPHGRSKNPGGRRANDKNRTRGRKSAG
jgi:AraC-like DNA-binding protein